MKHALSILLVLSLLLVFAACGDDEKSDNTYTTSNLPSRYAVDIPKTLKGGSTTPTAPKRVKGLAPQSMALQQIKNDVAQFEMMQKQVPMQFVMVDAVLPTLLQRLGDANEVTASDLKMTITQALLDKVKAIMGAELWAEMEGSVSGMLGMEMPMGTTTYKKLASDPLYQHLIIMVMSTDATNTDKMTIRWSTDKTKVSIAFNSVFSGSESSQLCTFDSTKNTSFMSFKMEGMTISMAFEQTDATKHGIKIKTTSKWTMEGTTTIYETVGLADDDGGYLEMFSTSGTDKWGYRESFNGTGEQTGYAYKGPSDSDWVVMNALDDSSYYSEDTSTFTVTEVKVVVNGLPTGSEYDFFIVPSGTTTIDESTTMFGSGHFDGVSMTNDTSWVMYWGAENNVANAIVFKAEFNGSDITFSQINGASVSVAPAP